jgi:ribonuclease HI
MFPPVSCTKVNCDGSSFGNPIFGSNGVVFRASPSFFIGALAQNIGIKSSLEAEFGACMFAMEKADDMDLRDIWIETDSLSVVKAFSKQEGVPWRMNTRWHNCMHICRQIRRIFTHVLREGNMVVDTLARNGHGLAHCSPQWWEYPPSFISTLLVRDSLGLPFTMVSMD